VFLHWIYLNGTVASNTLNLPNSYAKSLCEQLILSDLKITWRCILYPWKIDDDLAEKMAKAGCKEVSLGFDF
jgi:hypothetical protein